MTSDPKDRRRRRTLSAEEFERLLKALDPDPARAGEAYERFRTKLRVFFSSRRCPIASDLVDVTFDRVARKLLDVSAGEIRDIPAFILGVGRYVLMEYSRDPARHAVPFEAGVAHPSQSQSEPDAWRLEEVDQALAACLDQLAPDDRVLIKDYYQGERRAKIDGRLELANRLGIKMTTLTMRAFHIRRRLETCLNQRLGAKVTVSA